MPWGSAILLGLLTGVLGGAYAGFVADRAVAWLRVSSFEGASSYVVVGMALLGFVGGTIIGIAACRIAGSEGPGGMVRGFGAALLLVGGIVTAAGALAWASREQEPRLAIGTSAAAQALDLMVEVRMPEGWPRPVPHREGATYVDLESAGGRGTRDVLRLAEAREEDGRWILPATVEINATASSRVLAVRQPQQDTQYFPTPIPARPAALDEHWSAWLEPSPGTRAATAPERLLGIRYRVVARADAATTPDAQRRAAFAALPADAPPEALLPFLSVAWRDAIREQAVRRVLSRTGYAGVLATWVATADHDTARDAMFLVGSLNPPNAAFAEGVKARIAEVIGIAAAIEPGAPDSQRRLYAQAHVLATGIVAAAPGLWRAGIDLRPELRAMADAARPHETNPPRHIADEAAALVAHLDGLERSRALLEQATSGR